MTQAPANFERALHHHGDDLYRLALLLSPDPKHAAAALSRATAALAQPGVAFDEPALLQALVAALPPERPDRRPRRLRRPPAWAVAGDGADAPLLVALARLPRRQRLALGLTVLRDFAPDQAAPLFTPAEIKADVRDALLALAPSLQPPVSTDQFVGPAIPTACQPTRAALILGDTALDAEPAVRGHLALCGACRAAEQSWLRLNSAVEIALRGAFRDIVLPERVAEDMQAALVPQVAEARRTRSLRLWLPRLALPLVVALAIGGLVLPRSAAEPVASPPTGATVDRSPDELVDQALENLYAPVAGPGLWHGRWEIRWDFSDGLYAMLHADLWSDPSSGRHRAQLVHRDGGGPYEFELADGRANVYYAAVASYGQTIYPLIYERYGQQVAVELPPEQHQQMLRARLASGAWGIAADYLRQAQNAAELRSWGKQRAADGTELVVLGFHGYSPLGLPPGLPNAPADATTILLTVDHARGALREVRELSGPPGGEQVGRTTWRFLAENYVEQTNEINTVFDVRRAWTGQGDFTAQSGIADPALPLVPRSAVGSPADLLSSWEGGDWVPAAAPPGAGRAIVLGSPEPIVAPPELSIVYLGEGRLMVVHSNKNQIPFGQSGRSPEQVSVGGQQGQLQVGAARRYQAQFSRQFAQGGQVAVTHVFAYGFSYDEVQTTLQSLALFSAEQFLDQARLFVLREPHDPAALDALLAALRADEPLAAGEAQHTRYRHYMRQGQLDDPLRDPYHLPLFGGQPDELTTEIWSRRPRGDPQIEQVMVTSDAQGKVYRRLYAGPSRYQHYDGITREMVIQDGIDDSAQAASWWHMAAIELLGCGGARLEPLPDGRQALIRTENTWQAGGCTHSHYVGLLRAQNPAIAPPQRGAEIIYYGFEFDSSPYLADIADQPISFLLYLGQDGEPIGSEVRAGLGPDGLLLEALTVEVDERVSAAQAPARLFEDSWPEPLGVRDFSGGQSIWDAQPATRPLSLTEVVSVTGAPLWYAPPDQAIRLNAVLAVEQPTTFSRSSDEPFHMAFNRGLAVLLQYDVAVPFSPDLVLSTYQGDARQLGDFLRTRRFWTDSAPVELVLGGQPVVGWRVTQRDARQWTLVELEGTLIAIEHRPPADQTAIERLERLR